MVRGHQLRPLGHAAGRIQAVSARYLGASLAALLLGACGVASDADLPEPEASAVAPTEATLEPITDTSGFVVVGETKVYYTAHGQGDPVVIVHGGPALDQQYLRPWLDQIAEFARPIYLDQRGTGGSTGPLTSPEISFDNLVADIDRLRLTMGYEKVTVLGHSWGGLLAIAYALRYPDHLRGLILMSTSEPGTRFASQTGGNQQAGRSEEDQARLQEVMISEAFVEGDPAAVSEVFKIAFRSTLADPTDLTKLNLDLSEATARNRDEVSQALGATMTQPDWWNELSSLSVPTLIVHGLYDPLPVEMAQELADSIPGAEVTLLRDSGHFPFAEEPGPVMEALRAFVSR